MNGNLGVGGGDGGSPSLDFGCFVEILIDRKGLLVDSSGFVGVLIDRGGLSISC